MQCYIWKSQNTRQRKTGIIIPTLQAGEVRGCEFFMVSLVSATAGNKKEIPNSLFSQSHNLLWYLHLPDQATSVLCSVPGFWNYIPSVYNMNSAFK